jgi:hypothetical protein
MGEVISFEGYRPPPRYDLIPWTEARIYEALTESGTGTLIETIALTPDADPTDPAYRSFTTELGTAPELWYWIVFADGTGDTSPATDPVQNATSSFVSIDELFRVLKIRTPTPEQRAAGARVLSTAYVEILHEIDLPADVELTSAQRAIAAEVNLERAVEHWTQQEAPFGLVELTGIGSAERVARNSFERHAEKLAPLKAGWGIA